MDSHVDDREEVRLSALIPTFNSGPLIDRCLDALERSRVVDDVIVLDGGSSDDTVACAARRAGVRTLRMEGTTLSHRINAGMARARHEFVLVLNDDAFLDPETPAKLAEVLLDRPRIAVAAARLRYDDGTSQRSGGRHRTLGRAILDVLWLGGLAARVDRARVAERADAGLEPVSFVPLCAAAVRKSAFHDIAGLDERFSFYAEDHDFGRRLELAGWRGVVRDDAGAIHIGGGSTSATDPGPWFSRLHHSRFLYLQKHYPRGWRLYALAWGARASLHLAAWRLRALRHRLAGDTAQERTARHWALAMRQARRAPRPPGR